MIIGTAINFTFFIIISYFRNMSDEEEDIEDEEPEEDEDEDVED